MVVVVVVVVVWCGDGAAAAGGGAGVGFGGGAVFYFANSSPILSQYTGDYFSVVRSCVIAKAVKTPTFQRGGRLRSHAS